MAATDSTKRLVNYRYVQDPDTFRRLDGTIRATWRLPQSGSYLSKTRL